MSTLEITKELIKRESITPDDAGCQKYIQSLISDYDFIFENMDFADTKNLWAINHSNASKDEPVFLFAGHTDVVPPGSLDKWNTPPFEPTIKNNLLFGRGVADMKGSLAAMITATKRFLSDYPSHKGRIAFLITSDEEGPFINGTIKVIDELIKRNQKIDYAIVGEPSSSEQLGDVIKIGRRGSLTGWLTLHGKQGHVAYPHLASNAIHTASSFIHDVNSITWDHGNDNFPPTSLQITNISAGEAGNVIPGEIKIEFNFRFSTEQNFEMLKNKMCSSIEKHCTDYEIKWKHNGEPFLTTEPDLIDATKNAIKKICNIDTSPETSGGTSDGRFIAKTGAQIVELGPINKTIHQVNESVYIDDLETLSKLYYEILKSLLV